jgi:hypothetical protein
MLNSRLDQIAEQQQVTTICDNLGALKESTARNLEPLRG